MPTRAKSKSQSRSGTRGRSRSASRTTKKNNSLSSLCNCGPYIPHKDVSNLRKYKYSASDSSLVSLYIMKHYWDFVISFVPRSIAPNVLTLMGFVVGVSSPLFNLYLYSTGQEYPWWTWYYAAFCFFFYQTLDAIDGKQARRTGTGGPLGELFDHGCDAVITPIVQINLCLALRMPPWMAFCYVFFSSIGLFTSIWEQYGTGLFELGIVSGPVEGILFSVGMFLITGIKGQGFWVTSIRGKPLFETNIAIPAMVSTLLPNHPGTDFHLIIDTPRQVVFAFFVSSWATTVFFNVLHVFQRPPVHKKKNAAMHAALPTLIMTVVHYMVYLSFPELLTQFPFALELSYGLLISYTVTKLTVSRLCMTPFKGIFLLYVLNMSVSVAALLYAAAPCLSSRLPRETAIVYLGQSLRALVVLDLLFYLHMIVSVFRQVADYLGIAVLTIPHGK